MGTQGRRKGTPSLRVIDDVAGTRVRSGLAGTRGVRSRAPTATHPVTRRSMCYPNQYNNTGFEILNPNI